MASLVLVRHGIPLIDQNVPARDWALDPAHERDVVELRYRLSADTRSVAVSSSEPKAKRTAQILVGHAPHVDPRLDEVSRPHGWVDDYQQRVVRYLRGEPARGWEPKDEVLSRLHEATCDLAGGAAVVGHGIALTVLVSSLHDVDPVSFWKALTMPDAWLLRTGHLERV